MRVAFIALLAAILFQACSDPNTLEKSIGDSVAFETIIRSSHKLYENDSNQRDGARVFLFNSLESVNEYLATKIGDDENLDLLRSINFSEKSIVIVDLPMQRTGYIQIEITEIVVSDSGTLEVSAERLVPGDHAYTDDIGYPVHAVTISRSELPISLKEVVDVTQD